MVHIPAHEPPHHSLSQWLWPHYTHFNNFSPKKPQQTINNAPQSALILTRCTIHQRCNKCGTRLRINWCHNTCPWTNQPRFVFELWIFKCWPVLITRFFKYWFSKSTFHKNAGNGILHISCSATKTGDKRQDIYQFSNLFSTFEMTTLFLNGLLAGGKRITCNAHKVYAKVSIFSLKVSLYPIRIFSVLVFVKFMPWKKKQKTFWLLDRASCMNLKEGLFSLPASKKRSKFWIKITNEGQ